ncbi:MAG: acetate--CoA ligase family protein [Anaerolineaceae bacterium]|nr:acetate--CoA ligase family protein [Anaerolineaceae bacterium]
MNKINYFFKPHGVALIGASSNPNKLSYGVLVNMTQYGYGGNVYPVNPRSEEILGLKCFPDISHVPDPVDLAVIMIPAPYVPETLEACGKRGVKAVTIISGGFKEVGESGASLEKRCLEIAHEFNMRLIGPNCVGTMYLENGFNTTFIRGVPDRGHIGFISQSGAVCGAVVDYVMGKGIGFSHLVSMGNEADVNETDLIEYLSEEPNVRVIAAYIEAIQDGERFIEVARRVTRNKPIVVLKAGRSEAGERAVSSHTGSLAGSYEAYKAAFRQSGVIEAKSALELFDISMALCSQPIPAGKRAVIITNAGGPAALASDNLADFGFSLADLHSETKSFLQRKLNPSAQVDNPIDMLGGASPEEYALALDATINDENVDIAIPINVPTSIVNPVDIAAAFADAAGKTTKTVISCIMGDASTKDARKLLHSRDVPMYMFPEQIGSVLGAMVAYKQWLETSYEPVSVISDVSVEKARKVLGSQPTVRYLSEASVRPLLQAYGISIVPGRTASNIKEAIEIAGELGLPVAMKIVSPDILHKSDAGCIKLNVKSSEDVSSVYQKLLENATLANPAARIDGMLIEKMAPAGHEVIIGMKRDPQFGPLMMFGMGGIYVELLTYISFRIAPMSHRDARKMIMETKAGNLLAGMRAQMSADIDTTAECIMRLGQLAVDFPEIREIEINPLLVLAKGEGVLALDARAILE